MLQLKNINKRFGSKTVAQDINLNVEAGEILAVLGRAGCGKSTLLKTIVGLVRPDSGEIWLNGDNITDMPSEKRNISLMFQDYALLPHLTALDNVGFGLKMRRLPKAEIEEQSMQALRDIGLEHEAQRKPESLSGGEQQRLSLARALLHKPQILFLDEATNQLDDESALMLMQTLKQHLSDTLVIGISHQPKIQTLFDSSLNLNEKII